jgi:hypothetical protein
VTGFVGGCRIKPDEKTRSVLAEVHLTAAVHDALAKDRLHARNEMAVFGTHPYERSSGLARGFPDSHVEKQDSEPPLLFVVHSRSRASPGESAEFTRRRKWADRMP